MTILQLIIVPNAAAAPAFGFKNNNGRIPIPVFGVCSIKLINIQYHATGNPNHIIQIRSDVLSAPKSPCPFITFITNSSTNATYDAGYKEYSYERVVLNGGLTINVIDAATLAEPAGFQHAIITLQIEENIN
jgi:hypothetical protein